MRLRHNRERLVRESIRKWVNTYKSVKKDSRYALVSTERCPLCQHYLNRENWTCGGWCPVVQFTGERMCKRVPGIGDTAESDRAAENDSLQEQARYVIRFGNELLKAAGLDPEPFEG